jgi:hypothetical protein
MGEIADDMTDGLCCSECGIYFIREHGYPVLCSGCHTEKSTLPEATIPELGEGEDTGIFTKVEK